MKSKPLTKFFYGLAFHVCILAPSISFAQNSYLGASLGPSFVLGANGVPGNGYLMQVSSLKTFQATIDGAYFFNPNNGVYGMVGYSDQIYNSTTSIMTSDTNGFFSQNIVARGRSQNLFFFVGPLIGFGNKKLFFDIKAALGFYSTISDTMYNNDYPQNSYPKVTMFGGMVGASIHYYYNQHFSFVLKCDMILTTFSFYLTNISPDVGIAYNFGPPEK